MEKRRLQDKVGDRLMEVFRFVDKSKNAVTATDVADALNSMDGETAGTYLRRLKRPATSFELVAASTCRLRQIRKTPCVQRRVRSVRLEESSR